jgi:4-hydroxybenzoate polyprenyltransferase
MNIRLRSIKQELRWIISVSRPRFWIYLFGPFLLGFAGAIHTTGIFGTTFAMRLEGLSSFAVNILHAINFAFIIANPTDALKLALILVLIFGYFLFPANLLIYGTNDIFDRETDLLNPKKNGYESLLPPAKYRRLLVWIIVSQLPWIWACTVLSLLATGSEVAIFIPLAIFLFLGIFYSAPPIRAKTKPFLDSLFNILYVMPALVSYTFALALMTNGTSIPWAAFLAGSCWCMAMHAYSAVPDIKADLGANLQTIATKLGARKTLFACLGLYVSATILGCLAVDTQAFRLLLASLGLVYVAMMCLSLMEEDITPIYKRFPLVNTLAGACLFLGTLLL